MDDSMPPSKPWQLDKIYIVDANGTFRAQPPTKVIQAGQTITWDGLKQRLEFVDDAGGRLANIQYTNNNTVATAKVNAPTGDFFQYNLLCKGLPVQGNSPPVIVVE